MRYVRSIALDTVYVNGVGGRTSEVHLLPQKRVASNYLLARRFK